MQSSNHYLILTWDRNKQHILHADLSESEADAETWAYARLGDHLNNASAIITYRIQPHPDKPDSFVAISQLTHNIIEQS